MTESNSPTLADEEKSTGLPWPKTWNGAYAFVIANFLILVMLLLVLKELH